MERTGQAGDWPLTLSHHAGRAAGALRRVYDGAGGMWMRTSPASFARARTLLLGEAMPPVPPPLPPYGSTLEVDGIAMRVDPRMSEHNVRKLMAGRHTRHERSLLARFLAPGDRLMELGGGIGMVAIMAGRALGSGAVFSYEANPDLESLIRGNYALNGVSPDLTIAMLGHESGTRTFHRAPRFSRSSAHVAEEGSVAVEVPVLPLAAELARTGANVMVVDIQGGEEELLLAADLSPVRLLLVEVHADLIGIRRANALRRHIRAQGFQERGSAGNSFVFERP